MSKNSFDKDEWSQEEFLENKKTLFEDGIETVLISLSLKKIDGIDSIMYNPFELDQYPKGTYFVFYCDSGKESLDRLKEFRSKFEGYKCISLHGGRGYWRKNLR